MGDIEFLAKKEFDGKLRSAQGFLSAVGDLATLTANTGKDMYVSGAKITYFQEDEVNAVSGNEVTLVVNGVTVETTNWTTGSDQGPATTVYEFKNIGLKVLAGQIIKIQVVSIDGSASIEGVLQCFEETTGATPQVPPLNPV